jgi:adenylate cyclase
LSEERASQTLQKILEQKQKQLDLIAAIDEIRDTEYEPSAMLSAIVNLLTAQFDTDLCLLSLLHRDTGELELKAFNDRGNYLKQIGAETLRRLSERALAVDSVEIWRADEVPDEVGGADLPEKAQLAAVPIIMRANMRLGALLLARTERPFSQEDIELLRVAEDHVDSAIVQGYAYDDLRLRNKELETIYRVDRIRDRPLSFDEMLNAVLQELRGAIQAEMGFIMLYNQTGGKLELRAVSHDDLFRTTPHQEVVQRVADESLSKARLVFKNDLEGEVRSVMCVPLILHNEILGVFGVVNRYGPRGFDEKDHRLLNAIASQMDTAIFESLEQRRLRQVLGRSVDPRVMQRLLANPDVDFLKGERTVLSVLYADLRGSTALAERTDPEVLVGFINDYLGQMVEVILSHEGTLDKFVGDEVMALFGAPFPLPDHALRAVRVGLAMQEAHVGVMEAWRARGLEPAPIGVGIASGELIAGEMGSAQRTDYTVIGRAANLGARICTAAEGGQVLISQETYDLVKGRVEATPVSGLHLKGISGDVTVHHVTRVMD